jgi:prepilin-type N-terminal cleavage/methylation domain-containing protein
MSFRACRFLGQRSSEGHASFIEHDEQVAAQPRLADDAGFTLIEVLVSTVVLAIIIAGIGAVVTTTFRNQTDVSTRLSDSHDAQITSTYFVRDVQDSTRIEATSSPSRTDTAVIASGSTTVVDSTIALGDQGKRVSGTGIGPGRYVGTVSPGTSFQLSSDPTSQVDATATANGTSATVGGPLCPNGSQAGLSSTGTQVLGLYWSTSPSNVTAVSFVTTSFGGSPALVRSFCSNSTPSTSTVQAHGIHSISPVTVTFACAFNPACQTQANGSLIPSAGVATVQLQVSEQSGFTYTLSSSPRIASQGGSFPPGSSPLALLLLGSGSGVLNCAGSGGGGPLIVNGVGAVNSSSSGSMTFSGGDTMQANGVYTQSPSPVSPAGAYGGPYGQGPPIPDPYATLPDPDTSTLPTQVSSSSLAGGPGVYTNAVSIASKQAIRPGIYVFEKGLAIGGLPGTTVSGTGVFFFIGIPNAAPGTPQTAAYSVTGNGAVNLTAPATGTYAGVVIFQSRTDSNTLQIAGNGTNSTYGGVIYAPDAAVNTSGNGTTSAASIVVGSLICGGNGAVQIGATSTNLTSSNNPSTSGQSVQFTATVSNPAGSSPGGTVKFTETPNGSSTPVTLAGCSAAPVGNGQASCTTTTLVASGSPYTITAIYENGASQGSMSQTVNRGSQTITFTSTPPNNATVGGPTYTVTATGGASGNPVTFSIDPSAASVCSIIGSVVSFTSAGTCVIDANQPGSADYNAAPQAQQSFPVYSGYGPPTITGVQHSGGNSKVQFTGTGTPGGAITVTICKANSFPCTGGNNAGTVGATVSPNAVWVTGSSGNLNTSTSYWAQATETAPAGTSAVFGPFTPETSTVPVPTITAPDPTTCYYNTNAANCTGTSSSWTTEGSKIAGTASSGLTSVQVAIENPNGAWWNGSSFTSLTPIYFGTSGTSPWTYALTAAQLGTTAGTFTIQATATDTNNNTSGAATQTFIWKD